MTQPESNLPPDIVDLFADDAFGELDIDGLKKLSRLSPVEQDEAEQLRLTVGMLQLAFMGDDLEAMPVELRNKIAADAPEHLVRSVPVSIDPSVTSQSSGTTISRREKLSWLVTAASILLAFGIWISSRSPQTVTTITNLVQERNVLINQVDDRIEVAWTSGTTPFEAEVTGDVVWSNSLQQGFLRFVGMPINDPAVQQYQLWIIDPVRDDEPIDGGVFDITAEGEVIIPINAKLNVIDPAAFAVTIEKPGGVVVSDQKRLPLLAKVPASF